MARPKKYRRVCGIPRVRSFVPDVDAQEQVTLTLDEAECIRLLDWEGMTQEQCAAQMLVTRTTVTSIYESARKKLADALVNGKRLTISGGEVIVCEHGTQCCGRCGAEKCGSCGRQCKHINH